MPQTNPPAHPYPGTRYQLRHAAANNQIIICRCSLCRRLVRYLATDLVELFLPGPGRPAAPVQLLGLRQKRLCHG